MEDDTYRHIGEAVKEHQKTEDEGKDVINPRYLPRFYPRYVGKSHLEVSQKVSYKENYQ